MRGAEALSTYAPIDGAEKLHIAYWSLEEVKLARLPRPTSHATRPGAVVRCGGSQNELLCQLTADATGLTVVAGPAEATAPGNVLLHPRAAGAAPAELCELRAIVVASHPGIRCRPRPWGRHLPAMADKNR